MRNLCLTPTFSLVLQWLPHFINSRVATAQEQDPHKWKPWAPELEPCLWKKSSGAKAVSYSRRLRSPAVEASKLETSCSRVIATNKSVRVKGGWGSVCTSVLKGELSIAAVPAMSWQLTAKSAMQTLTAFHFSIFYTRFHHFPRFDLSFRNCLIPTMVLL